MSVILKTLLLSILPISELRGAIPYAIANNVNPLLAFVIAVLGNFLVVPIVFFFLDKLHKYFLKIRSYERFFNKYVNAKRKNFEKHVGTKFEFWALVIFVAIPIPLTGGYSGTLLAWFFNIKRIKKYLIIIIVL